MLGDILLNVIHVAIILWHLLTEFPYYIIFNIVLSRLRSSFFGCIFGAYLNDTILASFAIDAGGCPILEYRYVVYIFLGQLHDALRLHLYAIKHEKRLDHGRG